MSRQSFLSTEFFVKATEQEARRAVCLLPDHLPQFTFLKENTVVGSMRFLHQSPGKPTHIYVDVSILLLDNLHVCLSLHGSFTNGHSFHNDPDISHALRYFEQAVKAALQNDFSALQLNHPAKVIKRSSGNFAKSLLSIFFSKYPA